MKAPGRVSDAELHAFVDGQLSDARAREIAGWLCDHPAEGARVGGWRAQNEALRRAFPPPPLERAPAILRVDERPKAPGAPAVSRSLSDYKFRLRRRRALVTSAAFAAGALVTGGLAILFQRLAPAADAPTPVRVEIVRAGPDAAALAATAWRTYASDRQHPVEATARDRGALAAWIAERTGLAALPEATGARLIGGRVIPGHEANAAFLLYEAADGERLALVAERSAALGGAAPRETRDGVRALAWTASGFEFGLAAALPETRLKGFAEAFASAMRTP